MRTRLSLLSLLTCVLVLGSIACGSSGQEAVSTSAPSETGTYTTVDVQTAYDQLSAGDGAQLVDVREPSEWAATGVPPGALLIPLVEVEQRAPAELAMDRPVYVLCNTGNRSRTAADTLVRLGYTQVYNVQGGIRAWIRAGLPVEAYQP